MSFYPDLKTNASVLSWAKAFVEAVRKLDWAVSRYPVPTGTTLTIRGPVGAIPDGFLFENGASYPVETYPGLFNVIGYTYGGAGANFNVPNSGVFSVIKY